MRESGCLAAEILDEGLKTTGSETSIEVNSAVLKLKHTIKKRRNENFREIENSAGNSDVVNRNRPYFFSCA
ncbi:MAG: hypothetical protein U9O97_03950 [Elusimicrobiota bacterium]|nr:hypothetical protein [Elusimicrobiota bacterium]